MKLNVICKRKKKERTKERLGEALVGAQHCLQRNVTFLLIYPRCSTSRATFPFSDFFSFLFVACIVYTLTQLYDTSTTPSEAKTSGLRATYTLSVFGEHVYVFEKQKLYKKKTE